MTTQLEAILAEREACAQLVEQRYTLMADLAPVAVDAVLQALPDAIRNRPTPASEEVATLTEIVTVGSVDGWTGKPRDLASRQLEAGRIAELEAELDRFMRPDARALSTSDPIVRLPTFKPPHLRGLALVFREWCHAEMWGRPQEAELAARQVETAFVRIQELEAALKPFAEMQTSTEAITDAMSGRGEWAKASVQRRIEMMGECKRARDAAIISARNTLARP